MRLRRVEVVERARDQQIGVGVEVFGELVALVAQVRLDLELDVEVEVERAPLRSARPNFSAMSSSDRYVMWPIMRATRRPRRGIMPCA